MSTCSVPVTESVTAPEATRREFTDDSLGAALAAQWKSAPWYVSSLALHLAVFLFLLILPGDAPKPAPKRTVIVTDVIVAEEKEEEKQLDIKERDPEVVSENEPEEVAPIVITADFELSDHNETDDNLDLNSALGDPDCVSTFDEVSGSPALMGVGDSGGMGGAGKFGNRFGGGKRNLLNRNGGGRRTESALDKGLDWLARHQAADGSWPLFPKEEYFNGRFGFPLERHLPLHSDAQGRRNEYCMNRIRIPYDMTLAVELDNVDDHIYVYINDSERGPFPDAGGHADAQWSGTFEVKKGDEFRIKAHSTCVGQIWAAGRYHDAKHPSSEVRHRAPYFRTDAGQTALCLAAFLGAGNTTKYGKYRNTVQKAVKYLSGVSYEEFGTQLPAPIAYEAPIMIMALVELYGMDQDSKIKRQVESLVEMGVKYQLPNGAWPENMATDKVGSWHNTAWWLSTMKSSRIAGFNVPDSVFSKTIATLDTCLGENGASLSGESGSRLGLVSCMTERPAGQNGGPRVDSLVGDLRLSSKGYTDEPRLLGPQLALSAVPEMFLSVNAADRDKPKLAATAAALAAEGNNQSGEWDWPGTNSGGGKSFYSAVYWFWTGSSLFRLGTKSDHWKAWNNRSLKKYLLATQAQSGKWGATLTSDPSVAGRLEGGDINGSWPGVFLRDGSEPFTDMGQTGATAFGCLMLEVYYRYDR